MITRMVANQRGFSPLLISILLGVLLLVGGYYIQERTNFSPKAEEVCQEGWEKKDPECDWEAKKVYDVCRNSQSGEYIRINGHQVPGQCGFETSVENRSGRCSDKDKYYCDYSKDTKGKRIFKTGGYYTDSPSDPLFGERDVNGCVYDFQPKPEPCEASDEVINVPVDPNSSANRPDLIVENKTEGSDGDVCEYSRYCDSGDGVKSGNQRCFGEASDGICQPNGSACGECKAVSTELKAHNQGGTGLPEPVCKEQVSIKAVLDPGLALRLMRYYAILKGASEVCVNADLGLSEEGIVAKSVTGEEGDLLFCSGSDGVIEWKIESFDSDFTVKASGDFSADILIPYAKQAEEILQVK